MISFEQLEVQKAELLALVADLPVERLAQHTLPQEWSAAQVFDHLVKVETEILAAARAGTRTPHRIGLRDHVGTWFVHKIFRSDRKVKVPNSASHVLPDEEPDWASIQDRWLSSRRELKDFLQKLTPAQQKLGIFRHPVCGWMNVEKIVEFFSVHMTHHQFQLARIKAAQQQLEITQQSRPA